MRQAAEGRKNKPASDMPHVGPPMVYAPVIPAPWPSLNTHHSVTRLHLVPHLGRLCSENVQSKDNGFSFFEYAPCGLP